MNKGGFSKYETFREYRAHCSAIKKMCDYVSLFGQVNRELIEGDLDKKSRSKKTSRHMITQHFVQATECLEKINDILNTICV